MWWMSHRHVRTFPSSFSRRSWPSRPSYADKFSNQSWSQINCGNFLSFLSFFLSQTIFSSPIWSVDGRCKCTCKKLETCRPCFFERDIGANRFWWWKHGFHSIRHSARARFISLLWNRMWVQTNTTIHTNTTVQMQKNQITSVKWSFFCKNISFSFFLFPFSFV